MTPVDLASEQTPQEGRPEQLANKSIQADDASKLAKDWYKSAAEYLAIENSQHAHPLKPVQYRPGIFVFGIAPQTVRLALICELLLKSLIVFEGKDPKKRHRLDKLYELIDQEDKNAFEQYLEEHGSPWKGKTEKSFPSAPILSSSYVIGQIRERRITIPATGPFSKQQRVFWTTTYTKNSSGRL